MRHLPNLICLVRIALIWPILSALLSENYPLALLLFCVAAVSDGLDGFLAKRFNWQSTLGKVLDPVADKLLLVTVFIVGTMEGLVPLWLTAVAVARDVIIGAGALTYRLWIGPLHGRPTIVSKINTGVQLLYLLCVMVQAGYGFPGSSMLAMVAVITLITTLVSGADYIITFTRRAFAQRTSTP